jgi:acyl-coenzyme A synthetase/AMP-(fatty) acid ligase
VATPPKFPHEFNLADYFLFDRLSEGLGDKVAILFGEERYTYAGVAERVRCLRGFFAITGLAREERVLILLHDSPAFVWAFFATLYHGAVVAMGNPDAPASDLAYLVEYTRAAVVITHLRTADLICPALAVARLRALILVPEVPTGGDVEGDPWSATPPNSRGPSSMPSTWSFAGPSSGTPGPCSVEGSVQDALSAVESSIPSVSSALSGPSSCASGPISIGPLPSSLEPLPSSVGPLPSSVEPLPSSAAGEDKSITLPPPAIRGGPSSTPPSSLPAPSSTPTSSLVRPSPTATLLTAPFRVMAALSPTSLRDALERGRSSYPDRAPPRRTKRDDIAVWLFTSGSTGRSKAAIHTHRDFAYSTECYAKRTIGYRQDDITASVSRLFFGYATGTNLMFPFAVGGAVGLIAERPTPEMLALAIERYRPTVVTNVPTMMSKLLEYDEARAAAGQPRLDLSSVRFYLSAGEALPPALLERFTARFKSDVYDGIGSAEMFHIYCTNRPGDIKPGSLGRVVDGYTIKILRSEAIGPGEPDLPPGETGVMWVKGDSVAIGYFQDRDKSWATFYGHWCRTGDLFRLDEEGYLWFSGRADDLLKVGGVWVSPVEVEDCLTQHPKVALAAVIGAEEGGLTKPKAFIVVRDEEKKAIATEEGRAALAAELKSHVKTKLSKHKYPRWVVFVDDVPKNDRGKVDRKTLKERQAQDKNPTGY